MKDYQFTIKPEHKQYVQMVESHIKAGAVTCEWNTINTKDGTVFSMEFKEQYQVNEFVQDLKRSFHYLFI